ncbi:hypothetical protein ACET3Z_017819 [Daucus carota]
MDSSNSERIDSVQTAVRDANQTKTDRNDIVFGSMTSVVSDVVRRRRGRPRGRARDVMEKYEESVNNKEDTSVVTKRKRGRPLKHPASISSSAGETHDSSIMKRKRGRPKGNLDNSGSGSGAVVLMDVRKRGRPRHDQPITGDTTLRTAGRPPNSSSKEQTNHSRNSGEQEQCPSYSRTPFSDITNLNYHHNNGTGNTPGRDMRHANANDAAAELSQFARIPLSVMTNQKLSLSRQSNFGKENIIQTAQSINNGALLRRSNLGKEKVGVHCTPSVPVFKGRKPFEANTGLCKNLGASFQDADPLSYCYSDAEFENNDALIPDSQLVDTDFDDDFHYILEKPSDVESSNDSDTSEFIHANFNKDHILSQSTGMEMDMSGVASDGEMDPADDQYSSEFDGFSSDGYAGSFYSCGSDSESQSDEEVQSEIPRRGADHEIVRDLHPMEMFNPLSTLNTTRTDWRIRVRVGRIWPRISTEGNVSGYNLIMIDNQDSHLEAFVVSEAWNVLQDMMFEGQVYDIYSFVCCDSTGKLRPVSSNISIVLTSQTVVLPAPNEVSNIPRHKFEITELSQLYSLTRSYPLDVIPSHAIDVIGVAMDVEYVRCSESRFGSNFHMRFTLYDGRNYAKVIVFDDKIQDMEPLFQNNFSVEPILILASMRSIFIQGRLELISTGSTCIYVNPDYEEMRRVRLRLLDQW